MLMVKMPLDLIPTLEQRVQSGSLSSLAGRRIESISTSPPQSREIGIPPPQNVEVASAAPKDGGSGGGIPVWAIVVGAILATLGISVAVLWLWIKRRRISDTPDYEDFVLVDNVPIGSGSFADVYLARLRRKKFAGQLVAIKRFRPTDQNTADKRLREYHMMLNLQHEQLVKRATSLQALGQIAAAAVFPI